MELPNIYFNFGEIIEMLAINQFLFEFYQDYKIQQLELLNPVKSKPELNKYKGV